LFLGDDEHDKSQNRRQLLALAVMSVMLLVWLNYFAPPPPVQQPEEEQGQERPVGRETEPADETDVFAPGGADMPADIALPPVADAIDPSEDEVVLENDQLRLTFTRVGARLKQAEVLLGEEHGGEIEALVPPLPEGANIADAALPLSLHFSDGPLGGSLNKRRFEVTSTGPDHVEFALTIPDYARITKRFSLDGRGTVVNSEVSYRNLQDEPQRLGVDLTPAYYLTWAPYIDTADADNQFVYAAFIWRKENQNEMVYVSELEPDSEGRPYTRTVAQPDWISSRTAYYLVGFRPLFEQAQGRIAGRPDQYAFGLGVPRFVAEPGETHTERMEVYIGPNSQRLLASAEWESLPTALKFFTFPRFMDTFAKFLLDALHWTRDNTIPSYGVAIILLTLAIRILMFPLTMKQVKSMKKMQALGPDIEELRKKYEDDPQKQQQEMMKLWQESGANPMGGCLPLIVQMPVFIALYRMLGSAYELRGAPFLYITDLSAPDRLFKIPGMDQVPLIGDYLAYLNLIPILSAVAMMLSMRLSPQSMTMNPQQKVIMTVMPLAFSLMFYNFPAGLNLYVLTSTAVGIAQTHALRLFEKDVDPEELKKSKKKKKSRVGKSRQHWYNAAVAKKKQLEKEQSKGNGAGKQKTRDRAAERSPKKGKKKSKSSKKR